MTRGRQAWEESDPEVRDEVYEALELAAERVITPWRKAVYIAALETLQQISGDDSDYDDEEGGE